VIPRTVLIAVEPFGDGLSAERAGAAIGRGLLVGDPSLGIDHCPIDAVARSGGPVTPARSGRPAVPARSGGPTAPGDLRELLEALDFDARMRAARAVVVGGARLDERTLLGSPTFEIATRARQAGVPAYAVTGENELSLFDARILDLQVILQAHDTRGLRRAGERLAGVVKV
jgi:glycerate kinase